MSTTWEAWASERGLEYSAGGVLPARKEQAFLGRGDRTFSAVAVPARVRGVVSGVRVCIDTVEGKNGSRTRVVGYPTVPTDTVIVVRPIATKLGPDSRRVPAAPVADPVFEGALRVRAKDADFARRALVAPVREALVELSDAHLRYAAGVVTLSFCPENPDTKELDVALGVVLSLCRFQAPQGGAYR